MPKNEAEGIRLLDLSAASGHPRGQTLRGRASFFGLGVPKDYAEAAKWFQLASKQKDPQAQYFLGYQYSVGQGVPKDLSKALPLMRASAEQNDADAQLMLGMWLKRGTGVERNEVEAAKWFQSAHANGNLEGTFQLGVAYNDGLGVKEDPIEAARLIRIAADQGQAEAQARIGGMLADGRGVQKNLIEAAKYIQSAAKQNDSLGLTYLGMLYESGEGLTKNPAEAVKAYRAAAAMGRISAAFRLGKMLMNGTGVPKDIPEGMKLLGIAAENNSTDAQVALADVFANGIEGVAKDPVQANKWYARAAVNGDVGARERLTKQMLSAPSVNALPDESIAYQPSRYFAPAVYGLANGGSVPGRLVDPALGDQPVTANQAGSYAVERIAEEARKQSIPEKLITKAILQGRFAPSFEDLAIATYGISHEGWNQRFGSIGDLPLMPMYLTGQREMLSGKDVLLRLLSEDSSRTREYLGFLPRKDYRYAEAQAALGPDRLRLLDVELARLNRSRSIAYWFTFWFTQRDEKVYIRRNEYNFLARAAQRWQASFGPMLAASKEVVYFQNRKRAETVGMPWCVNGGYALISAVHWTEVPNRISPELDRFWSSIGQSAGASGCRAAGLQIESYSGPGQLEPLIITRAKVGVAIGDREPPVHRLSGANSAITFDSINTELAEVDRKKEVKERIRRAEQACVDARRAFTEERDFEKGIGLVEGSVADGHLSCTQYAHSWLKVLENNPEDRSLFPPDFIDRCKRIILLALKQGFEWAIFYMQDLAIYFPEISATDRHHLLMLAGESDSFQAHMAICLAEPEEITLRYLNCMKVTKSVIFSILKRRDEILKAQDMLTGRIPPSKRNDLEKQFTAWRPKKYEEIRHLIPQSVRQLY